MKLLRTAVFGLPLAVLVLVTAGKRSVAQDQKERIRTVTITNGDTVINGKQLSKMDKKEREQLRKELRELETSLGPRGDGNTEVRIFNRRDGKGKVYGPERRIERRIYRDALPDNRHVFRFDGDSGVFAFGPDSLKPLRIDSLNRFHGRVFVPRDFSVAIPNSIRRISGIPGLSESNSQTYYFDNTDKDGISTRITIGVSDAPADKVKAYSSKEKADLEIQDLSFAPRFSSGDMLMMFSLADKGSADVKVYDSNKKQVFSGRATGEFSGKVPMPKNGIYYLVVDQNGRVAVKRIVKQ